MEAKRRSNHSYVMRLLLISTLFVISNVEMLNKAVIAQELFEPQSRLLQTLDDDDDDPDDPEPEADEEDNNDEEEVD